MVYRHFPNANGKFVVTGPGVIAGDVIETEEKRAIIMCRVLNEAFEAGKDAKIAEIKRVLVIG